MSPTLIALVPLLVVPVVGLLAFAGCSKFGAEPGTPEPVKPPPKKRPDPDPDPDPNPDPDPVPPDPPTTGNRYRDAIVNVAGEGFVAYWTLSDPTGTQATDLGPSKLHGAYTGDPRPVRATPGGALTPVGADVCTRFAADGGRMEVPFAPLLNPAANLKFSFEVWVRLLDADERPGTNETLVSGRGKDPGGDDTGWELTVSYQADGRRSWNARVFSGVGVASTIASVDAGVIGPSDTAWHLVVLTYDGTAPGTVSIHVRIVGDPQAYDASKTPAPYQSTTDGTSPISFGGYSGGMPARQFVGDLDEAAFFNTALTATQVQRHADAAR